MTTSIQVNSVSKQYRLGQTHQHTMLREAIGNFCRNPFKRRSQKNVFWALKDVGFSVSQGEVVGIVGANGAGKSTLLKVLSRITYPTSGNIKVKGRVASLLEVGTGFHEELSGRENIFLNGSILGMTKKEISARMDDIVAFAGVEKFLDTPIKRYSSGMWLRLGFAVAAHLNPDVLLVDEVLAVGDMQFQKKCLSAMDGMRGGGRTVLFVSHNMAAVENLCSRVIWIDKGGLRMDGEPKHVISQYLSSFATARQPGVTLDDASRRGTGEIRLTRIEYLDAAGQPMSVVRTGDRLFVRMHYKAVKPVEYPHFAMEIFTNLGTKIAELSTWAAGLETPRISRGEGHVTLEVDSLNLLPARYYLTFWICSDGKPDYDLLENTLALDIEASDFYKSGRGMHSRFGLICMPCRWSLGDDAACRQTIARPPTAESGEFGGPPSSRNDSSKEILTQ
jgi:lipopolysaccharide transport system ATP-binding protein